MPDDVYFGPIKSYKENLSILKVFKFILWFGYIYYKYYLYGDGLTIQRVTIIIYAAIVVKTD